MWLISLAWINDGELPQARRRTGNAVLSQNGTGGTWPGIVATPRRVCRATVVVLYGRLRSSLCARTIAVHEPRGEVDARMRNTQDQFAGPLRTRLLA